MASSYWLFGFIMFLLMVTITVAAQFFSSISACSPGESHIVCMREWIKAFGPVATLFAATLAGWAAIVAYENLKEVQKGGFVRVAEILRRQLTVTYTEQKISTDFDRQQLPLILPALQDPKPELPNWPPNDPQQAAIKSVTLALDPYSSALWSFQTMNDTTAPSTNRAAAMETTDGLRTRMLELARGPEGQTPDAINKWHSDFSSARTFFGKDWTKANIEYINSLTTNIQELQVNIRNFEQKVVGDGR